MNTPWLSTIETELMGRAGHPPQALCLVGVPGLGLQYLAERFARAVLSCTDLSLHPDYLKITPEAGKNVGIDTVREIQAYCVLPPTVAPRKVVHLQPIEALTLPAQQALLKTLEEPVASLSFILVCTAPHKILPTIRSRCQVLNVPAVPYSLAKTWVDVTEQEYALTSGGPLLLEESAFEDRRLAYRSLNWLLTQDKIPQEALKTLMKATPIDVLTGFYYALLHARSFDLLDRCTALLKNYAENANLNWEMNLTSFLIEVETHVV